MSLSVHSSWVVLAIALVIAAGAIVWYYRHTTPSTTRTARVALGTLRGVALALLILALAEPLLRRSYTTVRDPRVVVLVDRSQSMGIVDARGDRGAERRRVIDDLMSRSQKGLLDCAVFADSISSVQVDSLGTVTANGQATNISASLRAALAARDERNVQAVALITDGAFTAGADPRSIASTLGVPVYTIGIGDSAEPRDVIVTSVVANSAVLLGNALPVDVQLHASGFDGQPVTVTLSDNGATIGTQRLMLRPGAAEYAASFSSVPATPGLHTMRVAATPLAGELTDRNNSRTFFVRVIDARTTVAVYAGAPGPDVSFVMQSLAANPHITTLPFIQNASGGFLPTAQSGSLNDATCIVLVDFPTRTTSPQTISAIVDRLQRGNVPLLFVWGGDVDPQAAQRFDPWLPFTFAPTRALPQLVSLVVPPEALADPVMRVLGDARDSAAWHSLPPTTYLESAFKAKPGSAVLATMRLLGTTSRQPVILSQHLNRLRSLALLSAGTWRWRLLGKGLSDATGNPMPDVYSQFFTNAVQWLTASDAERRVRIQPVKSLFAPSDEIEFAGEVLDEKYAPVDDARVEAVVTGASGKFSLPLEARGGGRYYGSLGHMPEGDYTVVGTAALNQTTLGTDNGKFSVTDAGAEFQDTRMNAPLLRSVAAQTGGLFGTSADARRVLDSLFANPRLAPATVMHTSEIELWTNLWMLAVALAAFCAEWFFRKRLGLL